MRQIAVLIPSYQPGDYLKECLSALDKQTIPKEQFKVYLGLNGPQDPYREQINSLIAQSDSDIELFCFVRPGVSNARNQLIELSTEPYIAFVDDDDFISPDYLESLLQVATETVMGISNSLDFKDDLTQLQDNFVGQCFARLPDTESSQYQSRQFYSAPWAKLLHRSMIGDVRFDTRLSRGEDALFMACIAPRISACRKTPDSAVYYVRQRPNSASRRKVAAGEEISRVAYLLKRYSGMLFQRGRSISFVGSRIAASVLQLKNIL